MRAFPNISIPLHIFYSSFPLIYEDSDPVPLIPTPNSPHSHPDSPYSHHSHLIPRIPLISFPDSPFEQCQGNSGHLKNGLRYLNT